MHTVHMVEPVDIKDLKRGYPWHIKLSDGSVVTFQYQARTGRPNGTTNGNGSDNGGRRTGAGHRRKGYTAAFKRKVGKAIINRGDTPFHEVLAKYKVKSHTAARRWAKEYDA